VWLLGALLAVGVCSFVVVRGEQGDGAAFLARQRAVRPLTAAAVDRVVVAAPDPVTRARGLAARCAALGRAAPGGGAPSHGAQSVGALMNPWRCLITYRSGRAIQYLVTVHPDGSYVGDHELLAFRGRPYADTGTIEGCCIAIP
jgi:hypothetical protein